MEQAAEAACSLHIYSPGRLSFRLKGGILLPIHIIPTERRNLITNPHHSYRKEEPFHLSPAFLRRKKIDRQRGYFISLHLIGMAG